MATNQDLQAAIAVIATRIALNKLRAQESNFLTLTPSLKFDIEEIDDNYAVMLPITLRETHTASVGLSEYPIELTSNTTGLVDHVTRNPRQLEITAYVSDDTGAGFIEKVIAKVLDKDAGERPLSEIIFEKLRNWCEKGIVLDVLDCFSSYYENMMITSVTAPRELKEGAEISISMREVLFAQSESYKTEAEKQKKAPEKPANAKQKKQKTDKGKTNTLPWENNTQSSKEALPWE